MAAFPTTGVLDGFDAGANEALTSRAGWGALAFWPAEPTATTDAVPTYAGTAGVAAFRSNYWDGTLTDCEVWWTMSGISVEMDLWLRTTGMGGSLTGYSLTIGNTGRMRFRKVTAGSYGAALIDVTPAVAAAGDSWGMASYGTRHEVWRKPSGGSWRVEGSTTEASLASGVIGFEISGSAAQIAVFGGGASQKPATDIDYLAHPRPIRAGRNSV